MLKVLFGSKDKELILQYLLSMGSGYPSEIAKFWNINIPQINKMLISLKSDGILRSKSFGKTLVYSFNPNCIYVNELKALLKKARKSYDGPLFEMLKKLNQSLYQSYKSKKINGYYSGPIALNLFPDDNNGDWHSSIATNALKTGKSKSPYFIMGRQGKKSTKKYFKDDGIVDVGNIVSHMENKPNLTRAARPYRAVADMVVISLLNGKTTDHIQINDWLVTDEEERKFKNLIQNSLKKMNFAEQEKVALWMQKKQLN